MTLDEKIVKILYDRGKVQKKDLISVFKIHNANKTELEKLLVQLKVAKREDILEVKAELVGGEPYLLDPEKINMDIASNVPQAMAKRYNIVCPDETEEGEMIIAMHDPNDTFAIEYVQMRTGKKVKSYVALLEDLEDAWDLIYASESRKKHPFFTRKKTEKKPKKKIIPEKLTIPGFSKRSKVVVEDREKSETSIKKATEEIIEKSQDDCKPALDKLQNEIKVLSILSNSASILNTEMKEEKLIHKILETGTKICNSQGGSILLPEDEYFLYFREAVGPTSKQLLKLKVPLSEESIAGKVAIHRTPLAVNELEVKSSHYEEIDEMTNFETRNIACVPLLWGDELLGVMELVNKEDGDFNEKDLQHLSVLASQAAVALHNSMMMEQLQNFYMEVVEILIDALSALEPEHRDHSIDLARLASAISKELNLSEEEYENICYAAFLHDIGKLKTTPENDKEHPVEGAQILSHVKFFQDLVPLVRHHHERYDGKGYPDGLSGESIPLGARILAIAEGFIEEKHKHKKFSSEEFLEDFLADFGQKYDPGLKFVFEKAVRQLMEDEEFKKTRVVSKPSFIIGD